MKKILLQIVLIAAIVALGYWLYILLVTPMEFDKARGEREAVVVERLKEIRSAQRAYRSKYGRFTSNFDTLINFVKNDSLSYEMAIGSEDDSLAFAKGLVKKVKFNLAVKDTIFKQGFNAENLRFIPFSDVVDATLNQKAKGDFAQFKMDTISIETESKVVVPVFEAIAPYATFLGDLDKQELINFRDYRINTLGKDDGLKVGSLTSTNNEAGNWE